MNATNASDPSCSFVRPTPASSLCELISLDEWQDFVDSHPESTPLHHRKWIELLVAHYGYRLFLPAIRCEGRLTAATAFVETSTLLGARKLVSLPFSDCFTPLSCDDATTYALIEWFREKHGADASTVTIRMEKVLNEYSHNQRWHRHRIKLDPEMSDLLPRLPATVRRNVRRAEKNGLEFEICSNVGAVDEFYRLHVLTRRRLGLPVQAKSFFRRLHQTIIEEGLGFVGVVRSGRSAVAAAIFTNDNRTMMYKYGASNPASLNQRPNDFLFFNAIKFAARKCQFFDFGVTHVRDEGLRRFKRKWGADEEEVYDVCVAGNPSEFPLDSRAMKLTSAIIRRSPTFVCCILGRVFYRFGV